MHRFIGARLLRAKSSCLMRPPRPGKIKLGRAAGAYAPFSTGHIDSNNWRNLLTASCAIAKRERALQGEGAAPRRQGCERMDRFLCGLAAGMAAKLGTHPLDVAKKRFQVRHARLTLGPGMVCGRLFLWCKVTGQWIRPITLSQGALSGSVLGESVMSCRSLTDTTQILKCVLPNVVDKVCSGVAHASAHCAYCTGGRLPVASRRARTQVDTLSLPAYLVLMRQPRNCYVGPPTGNLYN